MKSFKNITVIFTVISIICLVELTNAALMDKIRDDSDLSQFYSLLERNAVAEATLNLRSVTIFVPTNEAFQRFKSNSTAEVLYHMSTTALERDQLPKPPRIVASDMDGNPPLYITRNRNGDIYVNNARLVPSRSITVHNSIGKKQVMHVIEEVLEPLTVLPTSKSEITNPDAFQFLTQADSMNIGQFRLRSYRSQVTLMKKENLYQSPGGHTFLIPIDDGFKSTTRSGLVDNKVIDGHVILNNVLFTAAVPMETPQTTGAFEDNIKVTVSFFTQPNGKVFVKSNTIMGDSKHSTGVVLAEIVKGNIPVRNGVVHLIQRPLMIIDTTVAQFLQDNENGALHKFYEVIMEMGGDILDDITKLGEVTILAPSNEAWNNTNLITYRNREQMRDILNMHIIKGRIDVEQIRRKNDAITKTDPMPVSETNPRIAQWTTLSNKTFLYFDIYSNNGNESITVEGGGVNATLIQADVAQTNGFVHIIDRVLGVPYTTVLGKLKSDPMINATYDLGRISGFNEQLNNTQRVFTYFVATDKGWDTTELKYPSAHKKLFMRDFIYHSKSILERHLIIADHAFSMQELVNMSKNSDSIVLPTYRDSLKLKVLEESAQPTDDFPISEKNWDEYYIMWRHIKIKVIRPDIVCTNGIIHVIELPFLVEQDIMVAAGGGILQAQISLSAFIANILMIFIVKFLL